MIDDLYLYIYLFPRIQYTGNIQPSQLVQGVTRHQFGLSKAYILDFIGQIAILNSIWEINRYLLALLTPKDKFKQHIIQGIIIKFVNFQY